MTDLNRGAAQFAQALFGGGAIEDEARRKEELRLLGVDDARAGLDRKITQAYLERDKRKALQDAEAKYVAAGVDPLQAAVMAGAHIGGFGNLEQAQRYEMRGRAEPALMAEGVTPANAILGALAGKPLPAVDIQGGHVITGQFGDAPSIGQTGKEAAAEAANWAQAGYRNARAGLTNVQSAAGGWNPNTGGRGGGPSMVQPGVYGNKPLREAAAVIDDAIAGGFDLTGFDPKAVAAEMKSSGSFKPLPKRGTDAIRIIRGGGVEVKPLAAAADNGGLAPSAPGSSAAPGLPGIGAPAAAQPKSKADYDALPSGTRFIAPDGTLRVKP